MRIVYISVQSTDARNMEPAVQAIAEENGWEIDMFCVNANDVDEDPILYHELVARTRIADLVLMRCMTEPGRMKRFVRYEQVLRDCPGFVVIYAGNMEIRLMYRDLFKGSDKDFILLGEYMRNRGSENDRSIVRWLHNKLTGEGEVPEPVTTRPNGVHHPDCDPDITLEDYLEERYVDGRPTVGILYTANLWIYNNQAHIYALIRELESRELNVIPVFFSTIVRNMKDDEGTAGVFRKYFMDGDRSRVDAVVMATPFSQLNGSRDCSGVYTPDEQNYFRYMTDVPVIQTMTVNSHFLDYEESSQGLSKGELIASIIWPEVDGQIITVPIGSNENGNSGARVYVPIEDRIVHLANVVQGWANLSHRPRSERRVAILMYQSRPESGRIGNASGLDTVESVSDMLIRFGKEGYTLDHIPGSGKALIEEIMDNITNDLEWSSSERIREKALDLVDKERYMEHYRKVPEFNRRMMEDSWGCPIGDVSVDGDRMVIPGIINGNILIGYQPLRSWSDQMEAVYHDPVIPMPHQYLEFYRWLKHDFKADVIFHMGTHGTLEWLPGKSVGLSGKCFPDLVLDGIPNIYPYIIDDPGEGIQCKRRSESVLIGHMCPTMARTGTYDELSEVDNALQTYFKAKGSAKGEKRASLVNDVLNAVKRAELLKDLHLDDDVSADEFEESIEDLHEYLTEIKNGMVRDGLHILGRPPEGERLDETVYTMMRLNNGDIPSLRSSFAGTMGFDLDSLIDDPSGFTDGELNSVILDDMDSRIMDMLREMRESGYDTERCIELASSRIGMTDALKRSLTYVCGTLVPNLLRMTDEMDNMMRGCDGRYVLPGPSGAPTRGNAHILPMGRNFYGIDPDIIPPRSSWEIGRRMADQMIQRYMDEKGCYPREIGFVIWATDTMKTNGDDVAYILWLMGVRPIWSKSGGQVIGLEVIPISELGRPRIDVTVRITGLFRDTFPNLIDLIDDAVKMVAELDESEEENYLAANLRKDMVEALAEGLTVDEARRRNSVRIFGAPPGGYGPGVNHAIETGDWKTVQDLADIYIAWGSYAYGRGVTGENMKDEFVKRFSKVGVTVKNMPDREFDLLDIDDVYGYLGGMNSFVRTYGKKDAMSFIGDGSDPGKVGLRDTKDEFNYVYRSKVLNPKFIEGLKKHGYRGVSEIANLTEYTFGWDATADIVDDWVYEKLAERYLFDEDTKEWMKDENPHAMMDMMNRLIEAYDRGMWDARPETIEKLKNIFLELEERIEEVNDR
ncbi:MAG: cobaltochelatase subunit CobN [Candidatus Methanomethylophilaceae archaeon]|nr:cobaltochelatase subunit CobN [Candidatus Methanomethylophilaceae archaeon]